jgi:hypothetical protein
MDQQLEKLANDFHLYKGSLKLAKYPSELWKQAVELTGCFSSLIISEKLGVNVRTLEKQIKKYKGGIESEIQFIPIQVDLASNSDSPSPKTSTGIKETISIEFQGTATALAEFMCIFQKGGKQC